MNRRILFVHNYPTTFVQIDLALLRERHAVREWYQRGRAVNVPALARAVAQSDLIFGWFASWHSFLPLLFARAFKRPSVLVVGGYDTANMPSIGYGSQRGGIKRIIARAAMRSASRLVTNSVYAREEVVCNAGIPSDRVAVIYLGLAAPPFRANGEKEDLVVTVGNVERDNLRRKGLEAFVRAAALLPEVPFVLMGAWRDDSIDALRSIAPRNVTFTGWIDDRALYAYLARARVYVQASSHESFGLAVAQAMSCECVPVVTRAGALPEVVGAAGIYLPDAEPRSVADGVRRALRADDTLGRQARERVAGEFSLERRRENLYQIIDTVASFHE